MISREHLKAPFEMVLTELLAGRLDPESGEVIPLKEPPAQDKIRIGYPMDLLLDELERVEKKFLKSYDAIAQILALARPIVDVLMLECGYIEVERYLGSKGRPPMSKVTLMLVHLLAQVSPIGAGSYRQFQRVLDSRPLWLRALELEKAPDHTTMSKFRTEMGPEFFKQFFQKLVFLLCELDLISGDVKAIVDSAPVEACMNFARSNATPKLDMAQVRAFFETVDFESLVQFVEAYRADKFGITGGRKSTYSTLSKLRFLVFEHLGGFLSRSQTLKYVKRHPAVGELIGFPAGKVPVDQTIRTFEEGAPPFGILWQQLYPQVAGFFGVPADVDEADAEIFFSVGSGSGNPVPTGTPGLGGAPPRSGRSWGIGHR